MTDWSEHYLKAREALKDAESAFRSGKYGEGCKALDSAVIAIHFTQGTFEAGRDINEDRSLEQ